MPKHHLIITGTGRNGTTFLVQLFTALGLDAGFRDPHAEIAANCNAGMEWDIRKPDAPYIVKSPWLCDELDGFLETSDVVIDHAIVPVRDLFSAAESRRDVSRRTDKSLFAGIIPGGVWRTENPKKQEEALAVQLYQLMFALAKRDIPLTLLHFPRFIHEPDYLYPKIAPFLSGATAEQFRQAFEQVAQPGLVHDFEQLKRRR